MILPDSAFIHPAGVHRNAVEQFLQKAVALLIEEMGQAETRSPLPTLEAMPSTTLPLQGLNEADLLAQLRSILRQSMNAAHPGFMGHMDSIPTTASIVGDLMAAALNNNMLSVEMSPVFSRLEPLLLRQIAQRFGLADQADGVLVSGGSLGNLQAIAVARNTHFPVLEKGLAGLQKPPVVFASEVAHTSIQKAAMVLGLGSQGVVSVPANANSQMDPELLRQSIIRAQEAGQAPFCVVATAGTTVTGNVDPLEAIADIAQEFGLWLHVDASYGGAVVFSPDHCHLLKGIEQADSVTFNPQKWLYVTKVCAMVLFRDGSAWRQHFQIAAPYMGNTGPWHNLGESSIQGTRHADVLKLWLSLQHLGEAGYAEIIGHNFQITEQFVAAVRDRPFLHLASQPQMNLVCFRSEPTTLPPEQWDDWNLKLQKHLLSEGKTFLSLPFYRGQRWLKAVLLNPFTERSHLDTLFASLDEFHGAIGAKRR